MKKYLLIPIFLITALATANAGCGSCEGSADKKCEKECKKECYTEKGEKSKSCCASSEEKGHSHGKKAAE